MTELAQFLLARIAEDERAARDVRPGPRTVRTNAPDVKQYLTIWHPDRALAECEAKRRIVEQTHEINRMDDLIEEHFGRGEEKLRAGQLLLMTLALPYADHPDYREQWRPRS
jgi:hypothetical protein